MSRREGTRTLALAFMAGVVGGFVGIAVTSWLADGPEILGASWWEVMTAIGTLGAASGAVWIANRVDRKAEEEKVWRKLTLKWFLMQKLSDIQFAAYLAQTEIQEMIELGGELEAIRQTPQYLAEAIGSLDLENVAMHMQSLHILGDVAPMYAEVLALARARHADLVRISRSKVNVANETPYLRHLHKQCLDLHEKVRTLVKREQGALLASK